MSVRTLTSSNPCFHHVGEMASMQGDALLPNPTPSPRFVLWIMSFWRLLPFKFRFSSGRDTEVASLEQKVEASSSRLAEMEDRLGRKDDEIEALKRMLEQSYHSELLT